MTIFTKIFLLILFNGEGLMGNEGRAFSSFPQHKMAFCKYMYVSSVFGYAFGFTWGFFAKVINAIECTPLSTPRVHFCPRILWNMH